MAAGVGDGELLRLNKFGKRNLNLRGEGVATGVGVGLGETSAKAFLRVRLVFGEGVGDSASDGAVAVSTGEAVAAAFLDRRCFAGEGNSLGVPVRSCE
jgi:hypothetical protein